MEEKAKEKEILTNMGIILNIFAYLESAESELIRLEDLAFKDNDIEVNEIPFIREHLNQVRMTLINKIQRDIALFRETF